MIYFSAMGARSRRKGKGGELELTKELTRLFGVTYRRGTQSRGGKEEADVVGIQGIHVECKRAEKLNLYAALDQAIGDRQDDNIPIVAHRKNGKEWVAIVRLDDLPRLAEILTTLQETPS